MSKKDIPKVLKEEIQGGKLYYKLKSMLNVRIVLKKWISSLLRLSEHKYIFEELLVLI